DARINRRHRQAAGRFITAWLVKNVTTLNGFAPPLFNASTLQLFNALTTAHHHALRSKPHLHHYRGDRRHLALDCAHFRRIEETIATSAATASRSRSPATGIHAARSASPTKNRRGPDPRIPGGAGPTRGNRTTAKSRTSKADSAATASTSSTSGIDAAIPEARIPHLEGTDEGHRGAATAYRTCASQNQARRYPICSPRDSSRSE